jgi:hypothetical protein
MDNKALLSIKSHPDYDTTIDEVINKEVDKNIMDEAIRRSKREERAEALYVILKLNNSHLYS